MTMEWEIKEKKIEKISDVFDKMKSNLTTKFIRMCATADEIQRWWRPQIGDLCVSKDDWWKGEEARIFVVGVDISIHDVKTTGGYVWLPTVDDLFEFLLRNEGIVHQTGVDGVSLRYLMNEFDRFLKQEKVFEEVNWASLPEIAIMFVMFVLYGKIWDNFSGEWIKIEKEDKDEDEDKNN